MMPCNYNELLHVYLFWDITVTLWVRILTDLPQIKIPVASSGPDPCQCLALSHWHCYPWLTWWSFPWALVAKLAPASLCACRLLLREDPLEALSFLLPSSSIFSIKRLGFQIEVVVLLISWDLQSSWAYLWGTLGGVVVNKGGLRVCLGRALLARNTAKR